MNKKNKRKNNFYKEEYLIYEKLDNNKKLQLFNKFSLLNKIKKQNNIIYSYDEKIFLKLKYININFYQLTFFSNKKYFKKIRKILLNYFNEINIIYSEFNIKNNLLFYKKFLYYENNLRKNILLILSKDNKDWFKDLNIYKICNKRKLINNKYFHEIYYSEFSDLKVIINKYWNNLNYIFNNNKNIFNKIDLINKKRNRNFHGRF